MSEKYTPSPEEIKSAKSNMTDEQARNSMWREDNLEGMDRDLPPQVLAPTLASFAYDPGTKTLQYFDGGRDQYGDPVWTRIPDQQGGVEILEAYIQKNKRESQEYTDRLEELKHRIEQGS